MKKKRGAPDLRGKEWEKKKGLSKSVPTAGTGEITIMVREGRNLSLEKVKYYRAAVNWCWSQEGGEEGKEPAVLGA